ncbi:MAG: riboflavin synthase [Sporolactobacillus sp.]
MFTGLIEAQGQVVSVDRRPQAMRADFRTPHLLDGVAIGDSIAVNGACVTVVSLGRQYFSVDIMPETRQSTTLQYLKIGERVNLERAIRGDARFGGHLVTGHVDGIGRIIRVEKAGNARLLDIEAAPELLAQLVVKGSVAVDGTSLTLFHVDNHALSVSLIPHTAGQTILGRRSIGECVNLEGDVLQKYVRAQITRPSEQAGRMKPQLTLEKLQENGFI